MRPPLDDDDLVFVKLRPLRPLHGPSVLTCKICSHWRSCVSKIVSFFLSQPHVTYTFMAQGPCQTPSPSPAFRVIVWWVRSFWTCLFMLKSAQTTMVALCCNCSGSGSRVLYPRTDTYKDSQMAKENNSWVERAQAMCMEEHIGQKVWHFGRLWQSG